jgi:type II secretory pathway component HofQ
MAGQLTNRNSEGFSVRRSSVTTNVLTENEQTLLLAGMTLQQTADQKSQVPLLGKLPIIRWFFSERSESDEERELLIFVTAEILE